MDNFAEYARYYDVLYKDKDYMSEAKDVDALLRKYGIGNEKRIITYGCGTGKHDRCLQELGYRIHGLDISENMVVEANKYSNDILYEVADIREYIPKEKYDAVISLFHVMSYQNTNDDVKNVMKSARKALNQGGLFLFDSWYGPGVLTDLPVVRVKEVEDDEIKIIRIARPDIHPNENIVDVNYTVLVSEKETEVTKRIEETHCMRYFFKTEIEEMLSQTGFRLVDYLDCRTLEKTDFNSWTCYFLAEAL